MTSCQPTQQKVTTTVTAEKVTYSDQGFYVEQQIIVAGNTVWGISEKVYGTGMSWREIVSQNPFLNTPDRLYYNPDRKMWIVKIFPGEVLTIRGQKVYPSCTYERITTATTTEPASSSSVPYIEGWGWLQVVGLIAMLIFIFWLYRRNAGAFSSSSSAVRVDIRNGIDQATELAVRTNILERQQYLKEDIWDDSYDVIRESARNNRLKGFTVNENENGIFVNADFRRDRRAERRDRNEPKQEEGK